MAKQIYKANDGSEHPTKEAAQRREALRKAANKLEEAVREVVTCLAASAMTADGHYFNTQQSENYYRIRESFTGMPRLERIDLWPHNLSVDFDRADNGLIVREYRYDDKRGGQYVDYKVCELYVDAKKAKAALVKACHERLAEFQKELSEAEKSANHA